MTINLLQLLLTRHHLLRVMHVTGVAAPVRILPPTLTRGFIGHVEIAATTATAAIKIASSMVDAEDGVKILRTGDRFRIRVRKTGTNDTFMAAERIYIGPNITSTDCCKSGGGRQGSPFLEYCGSREGVREYDCGRHSFC